MVEVPAAGVNLHAYGGQWVSSLARARTAAMRGISVPP